MMEYVSKSEVKPYRDLFEKEIISIIRTECKQKGLTFVCQLVGSARRNLIVRHHNKGFDCDYQILIKKNVAKLSGKDIKMLLLACFNKYMPDCFDYCEDSTSAITIKQKHGNKIQFSYDIVILLENDKGQIQILRRVRNGEQYNYIWNLLPNSNNLEDKIKLIESTNHYDELCELYYQKKVNKISGSNYQERKSFQLLNEAANEIIGKYRIRY